MPSPLTLNSNEYAINPVTDNHMAMLARAVSQQDNEIVVSADVDEQSKLAKLIKKVLIPTLPDTVISCDETGFCTFNISLQEIGLILGGVLRARLETAYETSTNEEERQKLAGLIGQMNQEAAALESKEGSVDIQSAIASVDNPPDSQSEETVDPGKLRQRIEKLTAKA